MSKAGLVIKDNLEESYIYGYSKIKKIKYIFYLYFPNILGDYIII